MFAKLKQFIEAGRYCWKYSGVIRSAWTAWNAYPGLDSPGLRDWVRPLLLDVSMLAFLTKTTVDDAIASAAVKIVDNDSTWSMVVLGARAIRDNAWYGNNDNGVIPESALLPELRDISPGCPQIAFAAIGLLMYLLQHRNRKEAA